MKGNDIIISKQDKQFDMSDILLCSKQGNKLFLLLNDKEQLDKFTRTGESKDAPICIKDYDVLLESQIYMSKKKLKDYEELDNGNTSVTFEDESTYEFSESSRDIIVENYKKQEVVPNTVIGNWRDENNTDEIRHKIKEVKKYNDNIHTSYFGMKLSLAGALISMIGFSCANVVARDSLEQGLILAVMGMIGVTLNMVSATRDHDIKNNNEKLKSACINELHDLGVSDEQINEYLNNEKGKSK